MRYSWVSVHLFCEKQHQVLRDVVVPLLQSLEREMGAFPWFFVRYASAGTHLRLRLKLTNFHAALVNHYWLKHVSLEGCPGVTKILFCCYVPEVRRYGGSKAMAMLEDQFCASSRHVAQWLQQPDEPNYQRILGRSLQMHFSYVLAMGMDRRRSRLFLRDTVNHWYPFSMDVLKSLDKSHSDRETQALFEQQFAGKKETLMPVLAKVGSMWRHRKTAFLPPWWVTWFESLAEFRKTWEKAFRRKDLLAPSTGLPGEDRELWPILESVIHMNNNRLGVANRDEAFLAYLLWRSLEFLELD